MKKCSASLIIKELQIKIQCCILSYHSEGPSTKYLQTIYTADLKKRESSYTLNVSWYGHCGEQYEVPKKTENRTTIPHSSPTPRYIPREIILFQCSSFLLLTCLSAHMRAYMTVCSAVSDSMRPRELQPTSHLCPWGFSRQEYMHGEYNTRIQAWSGLPCLPPGNLLTQGLNLCLLHWQAYSLPLCQLINTNTNFKFS